MVNIHEQEQPLTRLEILVLARLAASKAPSEEELTQTVHELALPQEAPARAQEAALAALAALRGRGLVEKPARLRKGSLGARSLTDEGGRVLRAVFGLARSPTWSQVRDSHLPALAFGQKPSSPQAKEMVGSADAISATVLRGLLELELEQAPTVSDVCDVLIAGMLGVPPGEITLNKIRAHVLAQRFQAEAKGEPREIAARVAARELKSRGAGKDAFDQALGRRWIQEEFKAAVPLGVVAPPVGVVAPPVRGAPVTPEPPVVKLSPVVKPPPVAVVPPSQPTSSTSTRTTAPSLSSTTQQQVDASAALLQLVREAITRVGQDGRFGDEKVFVSALWRNMEQEHRLGDLSLPRFKRWLVRANRDGWLRLVRADLISAMDAKLVADSEIEDHGATFHFVLDPQRDAAASERRSHVR